MHSNSARHTPVILLGMQPQVVLCRRAYFSAGRVLARTDWNEEKNRAIYGKEFFPHGHDYILDVSLEGTPAKDDGMVVNITDIKPLIAEAIAPLDGANLNELNYFNDRVPSGENIIEFLWNRFPQQIGDGTLHSLALQETRDFSIEKTMQTIKTTRRYEFAAAHRLHSSQLSDAENDRRYGKCNNAAGHGHNYGLEVTVAGTPDRESGVLIALPELDALVEKEVFDRFDHKHLNEDCPEFKNLIPTSENLARVIFDVLQKRLDSPRTKLSKIGLHETQKNYFEVEAT